MAVSPIVAEVLKRYSLQSLTGWASNAIINGWSEDQVMLEMYNRPEFKSRFSAIFALEEQGKPALSVDEYLTYEKTANALAAMWGTSLSKKETDALLAGSVSSVELERRFDIAAAAVYQSPQETRDELVRLHNISYGDQMKYWMNPKMEMGLIEQKFRMAEVSGAAIRSGYGLLNYQQALKLTEAGLTREKALAGFGELAANQELFTSMDIGEENITQDQQIDFLAGDADVAELIKTRQERRKAEFQGGGSFVASDEGFATGVAR